MTAVVHSDHRYRPLSSAGMAFLISMGGTAAVAKEVDDRVTTPSVEWVPSISPLKYAEHLNKSIAFIRDVNSITPVQTELSKTKPDIDVPSGVKLRGQLFDAIQDLRLTLNEWDSDLGIAPSSDALTYAEIVLAMLPQSYSDPKLGLGGSGDLYFSWENGKGVAFLTIDSNDLHLLLKSKVAKPVYWDKIAYDTQVLQNKILPALVQFAT